MKLPSYNLQALSIALSIPRVLSLPSQRFFSVGQEVNTTSGIIHGHAAANRTEVSEYLGIPFAQPPFNNLRFAAPKPYRSSAHFNASSFGLSCWTSVAPANYSILTAEGYHLAATTEEYFNTINEQGIALGEDCLTLNVWTKPQTGEKAKAVLFWIHGGGFQGGSSSNSFTTGQFLAEEQDVVIISANYRTNVFGFPGIEPEVAGIAPNAGLLDQRLAIEWARDNVAAFGGDPSRITLFGQSAGSASISMYGYTYASDPIVHGLISQSGTADSFGASPANNTAAWESVVNTLGCSNVSSSVASLSESVACVRSKPAVAVLNASLEAPYSSSLGAFAPSADGSSVFANYSALVAEGRFAQVPRLLGSNAQEGSQFQLDFALQGISLPNVFWEWYTLVIFTCPTSTAAASFASLAPSQPVWRYSYHGDYTNMQLTIDPSDGAYHGAEINPLFDTTTIFGVPDSPAESATALLMRSAWAAFAKDPHSALAKAPFRWPALPSSAMNITANTTGAAQTVLLGLGNATSAIFEPSTTGDALCPSVTPGLEAIGGPYGMLRLAMEPAAVIEALTGIQDGTSSPWVRRCFGLLLILPLNISKRALLSKFLTSLEHAYRDIYKPISL